MANWLRLDTVDEDDGETREVDAQQSLGDESPLEFERGYASVEDEETADDLARRYVHIERATPPEWADDDQREDEPLTAEQQAERRDDLDPSDVGESGGGQDAEGEQTHAEQRNMTDDTTNETEDAEAQTQNETDAQTEGQSETQADGQTETRDVTDQPANQQADDQQAETEAETEEQSVTDADRLGDMTVDEIERELNSGEYDDQLAEIEEAESEGKDRTGVHDAIDQRRGE